MKSIKMIKELNERLCDITVILSDAKRVKDEGLKKPLPHSFFILLYRQLFEIAIFLQSS